MKTSKSQKLVLGILYSIFGIMGTMMLFGIPIILENLFFAQKSINYDEMLIIINTVAIIALYGFLAYNLMKIVKCDVREIFSIENSNNFKRLGYGMVLLTVIDVIANLYNEIGIAIIGLSEMSIKPTSLIFLVIGLTNIYLSHVFKEGKRLKEENDLTI